MANLEIYDLVRSVPDSAKKTIGAGRLKGMTDINPMWRIKKLTEVFGMCGFGWKTEIANKWIETGANGEATANVEILLFVKYGGEWSEGIPGVGGSRLIAKESAGLYTDDECYKKAYTDALSVACKALGVGADVYFEKDSSKYDRPAEQGQKAPAAPPPKNAQPAKPAEPAKPSKAQQVVALIDKSPLTPGDVVNTVKEVFGEEIKVNAMTDGQFKMLTDILRGKIGGSYA